MSVIPGGCAKILQPLDVFINKQFKEYFLGKYDDWFHQGMFEYTAGGKGKFQSKKCRAQMKEREKCKQTSYHQPQCAKCFSRYSISKSGF